MTVQTLLAQVLTNQGIRAVARPYSHAPLPPGCMVAVEHDSSLRDTSPYRGVSVSKIEIKTMPATYRHLAEWFPTVLDIANYFGARVNSSCGLHVHHHLPEVEQHPQVVRNLMHFYWRYSDVLYALVAPSRKTSQYCRPPQLADATRFDKVRSYEQLCRELRRCDRYSGINVLNLTKSAEARTLEWRFASGSTDWVKIKNWILATQRWTEYATQRSIHFRAERVPNTQAGLNALLVVSGLKSNSRIVKCVDKELKQVGKYLRRRWAHFNERREYKGKAAAA